VEAMKNAYRVSFKWESLAKRYHNEDPDVGRIILK
jgi:hypothetical protein